MTTVFRIASNAPILAGSASTSSSSVALAATVTLCRSQRTQAAGTVLSRRYTPSRNSPAATSVRSRALAGRDGAEACCCSIRIPRWLVRPGTDRKPKSPVRPPTRHTAKLGQRRGHSRGRNAAVPVGKAGGRYPAAAPFAAARRRPWPPLAGGASASGVAAFAGTAPVGASARVSGSGWGASSGEADTPQASRRWRRR